MAMQIHNLNAPLGAEVSGIDVSDRAACRIDAIEAPGANGWSWFFTGKILRTLSSLRSARISASSIRRDLILMARRSTRNIPTRRYFQRG